MDSAVFMKVFRRTRQLKFVRLHQGFLLFVAFACAIGWLGKDGWIAKELSQPSVILPLEDPPPMPTFEEEMQRYGVCVMGKDNPACIPIQDIPIVNAR
jgi:hypothetical protein